MRKRGWVSKIFHSSPEMEADLRSRRVPHPETGKFMKHSVSRHCNLGYENLNWPNGQEFGRGTSFPRHITAGQITKIEKLVLCEYQKYTRNLESRVILCQDAGGAFRVIVELRRFGVEDVGAFIRNGSIGTVFPVDKGES